MARLLGLDFAVDMRTGYRVCRMSMAQVSFCHQVIDVSDKLHLLPLAAHSSYPV